MCWPVYKVFMEISCLPCSEIFKDALYFSFYSWCFFSLQLCLFLFLSLLLKHMKIKVLICYRSVVAMSVHAEATEPGNCETTAPKSDIFAKININVLLVSLKVKRGEVVFDFLISVYGKIKITMKKTVTFHSTSIFAVCFSVLVGHFTTLAVLHLSRSSVKGSCQIAFSS